jgi:hypothetical protein
MPDRQTQLSLLSAVISFELILRQTAAIRPASSALGIWWTDLPAHAKSWKKAFPKSFGSGIFVLASVKLTVASQERSSPATIFHRSHFDWSVGAQEVKSNATRCAHRP